MKRYGQQIMTFFERINTMNSSDKTQFLVVVKCQCQGDNKYTWSYTFGVILVEIYNKFLPPGTLVPAENS